MVILQIFLKSIMYDKNYYSPHQSFPDDMAKLSYVYLSKIQGGAINKVCFLTTYWFRSINVELLLNYKYQSNFMSV